MDDPSARMTAGPRVCAILVGMTAAAVLGGWVFDSPALKSVIPGYIAMQPWTATGLLCGALALFLGSSSHQAVRRASIIPAATLALVAGLPLIEYATGLATGTDTLLFPNSIRSGQTFAYANPGRMSAAAAVSLTALAVASALAPRLHRPALRALLSIAATLALVIGLAGLVAYVLTFEPVADRFLRDPLALHSAAAIALLAAGTLALHRDVGWVGRARRDGRRGWTTAMLWGLAVLMFMVSFESALRLGWIAADASAAYVHLETLLSDLKDAETGQRGYLLTNRPEYLRPYDAATARIPADLAAAEAAIARPSPTSSRATLRMLIDEKLAELWETVEWQHKGQPAAAMAIVESGRGEAEMDRITSEVQRLQAESLASETLASRAANVATLAALALGLLVLWGWLSSDGRQRRLAVALQATEREQHRLLATLANGHFMIRSLDGVIRYWSDGCARLYGWTAQEAIGQDARTLLQTAFLCPRDEVDAKLAETGAWSGRVRHRTRDGRRLVVTVSKRLQQGPGEEPVLLEALTDMTAQFEAEALLSEKEALLRAVIETSPGLIYAKDLQGRMILANAATASFVGKSGPALIGRTDAEFLDDAAQAAMIMQTDRAVMDGGHGQAVEEAVAGPDGQTRIWLSTKTVLQNDDREVVGLVGMSIDITDRKAAEERQQLMVHELNHRVKNTLATVQSIATQTLRGIDGDRLAALQSRLRALAVTHDVLTREAWTDADLADVIAGAMAPYAECDGARLTMTGPVLRLRPQAAVAISMAVHELLTNAIKYGALSDDRGRIAIEWGISDAEPPRMRLLWTESGGPAVVMPSARGFGSRLLERSLAHDLRGRVDLAFVPTGVTCVIDAPLADIAPLNQSTNFPQIGSAADHKAADHEAADHEAADHEAPDYGAGAIEQSASA